MQPRRLEGRDCHKGLSDRRCREVHTRAAQQAHACPVHQLLTQWRQYASLEQGRYATPLERPEKLQEQLHQISAEGVVVAKTR